jgi:hypothetical protein
MQVRDRQFRNVVFSAFGGDSLGANVMQPC